MYKVESFPPHAIRAPPPTAFEVRNVVAVIGTNDEDEDEDENENEAAAFFDLFVSLFFFFLCSSMSSLSRRAQSTAVQYVSTTSFRSLRR